jgi:hypothetical protein
MATVAYADLFDFPLDAAEVQRDLIGLAASDVQIAGALGQLCRSGELLADGAYLVLPGRRGLAETRWERSERAARMWPVAQRLGETLARFPYVRLVAVTGSLAAGNPDVRADIDYLIVTAPGRLWTVRALAILLVRLARQAGVALCPNYLLSTQALALEHQDLFTAHELLQATPVAASAVYRRMLDSNRWAERWLPNRYRRSREPLHALPATDVRQPAAEALLGGRLGERFEAWEARRKQQRLGRNGYGRFSADVCEGHFGSGRRRTLQTFADHCRQYGIVPPAVLDSLHPLPAEERIHEHRALRPVLLPAL